MLKRPAPVDLDAAVAALARRDGIRIMPDGATAAHRLGLTTAVPARASYVTDGATRTVGIDGGTIRFRHAGPRVMRWAGAGGVGGPGAALARSRCRPRRAVAAALKRCLPEAAKRDLGRNRRDLPGWALPLARDIAGEGGSSAMTADAFASFLALPEQERRDVFAAAARRLDTVPGYVEKDFWVCLVLEALFNRLPPAIRSCCSRAGPRSPGSSG